MSSPIGKIPEGRRTARLLILILAAESDARNQGNREGGVGERDIIVAEILLRKLPA